MNVPPWLAYALVIGGVVVLLVVFGPRLATSYARSQQVRECADLEARLASMRVAGGSADDAARLQAELDRCRESARELGADIDLGAETVRSCETQLQQVLLEWTHYRSTSYSDPVKRENTRGTMLRLGEDSVACMRMALDRVTTVAGAEKLLAFAQRNWAQWNAMRDCWLHDQAGCGRFAVNEPHGNDKAGDAGHRVADPTLALIPDIRVKIRELRRAADAATPTLAPGAINFAGLARLGRLG